MVRRPAAYRLFLKRLRQARIEAGLTQVEVSGMLRCPQSYVSKCESGARLVDVTGNTEPNAPTWSAARRSAIWAMNGS